MDPSDLADRRLLVPYAAAAWAAALVLALTVAIDRWGPIPAEPTTEMLIRLAGGWIALLVAALVWVIISEPIRLRDKVDEATERLQESERRFRELYDRAPMAYLTLDTDGTITRVNKRFEEIVGHPEEEVVGQPVLELFEPGEDGRKPARELLDRFQSGEPVRGEELAMTTAAGDTIWVTFTVRSVETPGKPEHPRTLSMVMDITERKRAEQRLEYYAKELERSNEDLQQFAYVVSHDLQEPIRMIKSYLELLERRYGEELTEEANEFIDYATDGADRMSTLIKSLLAYSRVGTQAEPFQEVDLGHVLEDVRADLAVSIDDTEARIETGELATVIADPNQIRQLVQNLVSNALKYSDKDEPQIRVSLEEGAGLQRLIVEDDGPGVPEDERDQIFDAFHRVGARPDTSGTGMGLAICKRIAERHGGGLKVEDSELGGARFVVVLPREPGEKAPPVATSPEQIEA